MDKHTPGPWFTEDGSIWHNAGLACIATVHHGITAADEISCAKDANARLIAAAPDLLDVARQLADVNEDHGLEISMLVRAAKAAVQKATRGEEDGAS